MLCCVLLQFIAGVGLLVVIVECIVVVVMGDNG